jgi:ribosomal protein L7/L12
MSTEPQDPMFDAVVQDALRLLESMSMYYGPERAMEMWEMLGPTMGEDVKATAFMHMLTGHGGTRVKIRADRCTQAVTAIKAIRTATGFGLKEAKDAWDLSKTQEVTIQAVDRNRARELRRELNDIGMIAK